MAAFLLLPLLLLSARAADAGPLAAGHPDFTASSYEYIDTRGSFLESNNGAFRAAIHNPGRQHHSFYLAVLHAPTGTPVWSANRDAPTGSSGRVHLTARGLSVTDADGATVLWSTAPRVAPIAALRLEDDGSLRPLDARNATLWQSFETLTTPRTLCSRGSICAPARTWRRGGAPVICAGASWCICRW